MINSVRLHLIQILDTRGARAMAVECRERGMPIDVALAILRSRS